MEKISKFFAVSIVLTAALLLFAGCISSEKPYETAGSPSPSLSPSVHPSISATPGEELPPSPPEESGGEQPPVTPS